MKLIYGFGILAVVLSAPSFSDECETWGCTSKIEELHTGADGNVYIGTSLDETKANCTALNGSKFVLSAEAKGAKAIYSSLLAAYMSDKKIQLRIVEGSSPCELAYVRFHRNF